MKLTNQELEDMVSRSYSLSDLNSIIQLNEEQKEFSSNERIEVRLSRWCQVVASGDWNKFYKRLAWDGLTKSQAHLFLDRTEDRPFVIKPNWANTVVEICGYFDRNLDNNDEPVQITYRNSIPFEELLFVLAQYGMDKLRSRIKDDYYAKQIFSEKAYQDLKAFLARTLSEIATPTLLHEFSLYKMHLGHRTTIDKNIDLSGKSNGLYSAFLKFIISDGLSSIFKKYPVLAKLLALRINQWVDASFELIKRIETDLDEIHQSFTGKCVSDPREKSVAGIHLGISDPHNRGRSVAIITFSSDLKIVYKPKNVNMESKFNLFLSWMNQQDIPLKFRVLNILNKDNYGWCEFVEYQPCDTIEAIERFYKRAGMLLCVLYVMGATDCHYENLIASGENLVLIDAETLLHPDAKLLDDELEGTAVDRLMNREFWDSVLRTGMLPRWGFRRGDKDAHDISGMGSFLLHQEHRHAFEYVDINTDNMRLEYHEIPVHLRQNLPVLNGDTVIPIGYLHSIKQGFMQAYNTLQLHKNFLISTTSPLIAFKSTKTRFIFRNTLVYNTILQKSFSPEFLLNGVDRSIFIEILGRAFLVVPNRPSAWIIFNFEKNSLENLDIPYFESKSDNTSLYCGRKRIVNNYFDGTSYKNIARRINKLGSEDLKQQLSIIQGTFDARLTVNEINHDFKTHSNEKFISDNDIPSEARDVNIYLSNAIKIASDIHKNAIRGKDGSVNWIGLTFLSNSLKFQYQPLDITLYSGQCGISLFFAALDYVNHREEYREDVLGALMPARLLTQSSRSTLLSAFTQLAGIGGAFGIGSIIYTLSKIGKFTGNNNLLDDAMVIADHITNDVIKSDKKLDVMSGSAGAILALLVLYEMTKEKHILHIAETCGDHLVSKMERLGENISGWRTVDNLPLSGYAHGAAGIAYALFRLFAFTQKEKFLDAGLEGIKYENTLFSNEYNNWPDLLIGFQKLSSPYTNRWCNGSSGIVLSRIGSFLNVPNAIFYQDFERAINSCLNTDNVVLDYLCCGRTGIIETLLVAGRRFSRCELEDAAYHLANELTFQEAQNKQFRLFSEVNGYIFNPSFFKGLSGIGYTFLRLVDPTKLPSILLWE